MSPINFRLQKSSAHVKQQLVIAPRVENNADYLNILLIFEIFLIGAPPLEKVMYLFT